MTIVAISRVLANIPFPSRLTLLAELCLFVGLGQHLARLLDPLPDVVSAAAIHDREVPGAPMVIHARRDDTFPLGSEKLF